MTAPPATTSVPGSGSLVLKNASLLLGAQVLVTPLAIVVNALMARHLGPTEFGQLYLASTFVAFGLAFVEWGHGAVLTSRTAQDRSQAGEMLGTSLAWRSVAALVVGGGLLLGSHLWGHGSDFVLILGLAMVAAVIGSLSVACQDVIRGYERTDVAAGTYVAYQLLASIAIVGVLVLGGRLSHVLCAQIFCALVGFIVTFNLIRMLGVPRPAVRFDACGQLFALGTPFLGFGLALLLQPNLDALLMTKWASAESIGWHAAARKLTGVLTVPASAIIGALYPTLCRLHATDRDQFNKVARSALRATTLLVVPVAIGCGLYPDLGVRIFNRETFGPAEDNLRVLSITLFLTYFSMPLGTCLAAAGLTKSWSVAQLGCVAVSAILDPILIRYFQAHGGNGGLGVCIASVVSEVFMVGFALWRVPAGVLDRELYGRLGMALVAGAAMAATALATTSLSPFISAPLAGLAYVAVLHWSRALRADEREFIAQRVRRVLRRAR
jgi:O-antigen/teichoic acid export membrane protein